MLIFFAGCEAFHAVAHAYLAVSRTTVKGHPAELLGIRVTRRFHAVAALLNGAVALGLAAGAWKRQTMARARRDEVHPPQPSGTFASAES